MKNTFFIVFLIMLLSCAMFTSCRATQSMNAAELLEADYYDWSSVSFVSPVKEYTYSFLWKGKEYHLIDRSDAELQDLRFYIEARNCKAEWVEPENVCYIQQEENAEEFFVLRSQTKPSIIALIPYREEKLYLFGEEPRPLAFCMERAGHGTGDGSLSHLP